jgi:hypothetical protein
MHKWSIDDHFKEEGTAMIRECLKYTGQFAMVGFAVAVIGAVIGLDGKTAADMAVGAQMAWVGWQLA